jgi:hypothetical protein
MNKIKCLLFLCILSNITLAQVQKKRVIIRNFSGFQSSMVRARILLVVAKRYTVVPLSEFEATFLKLSIVPEGEANLARIASELNIAAFVEGKIIKKRRRVIININIRNGRDGMIIGEVTRRGRIKIIKRLVSRLVDEVLMYIEISEPPARVSPSGTSLLPLSPTQAQPVAQLQEQVKKEIEASKGLPGEIIFGMIAVSPTKRTLKIAYLEDGKKGPGGYKGGFFPEGGVKIAFFPFSISSSNYLVRGLGIGFDFSHHLSIGSRGKDEQGNIVEYKTLQWSFLIKGIFKWFVSKKKSSPVLQISLGYGGFDFQIDENHRRLPSFKYRYFQLDLLGEPNFSAFGVAPDVSQYVVPFLGGGINFLTSLGPAGGVFGEEIKPLGYYVKLGVSGNLYKWLFYHVTLVNYLVFDCKFAQTEDDTSEFDAAKLKDAYLRVLTIGLGFRY